MKVDQACRACIVLVVLSWSSASEFGAIGKEEIYLPDTDCFERAVSRCSLSYQVCSRQADGTEICQGALTECAHCALSLEAFLDQLKCGEDNEITMSFLHGCASSTSKALVTCAIEHICIEDEASIETVSASLLFHRRNMVLTVSCFLLVFMLLFFLYQNQKIKIIPISPLPVPDKEVDDNDEFSDEDLDAIVIEDEEDFFLFSITKKPFSYTLHYMYVKCSKFVSSRIFPHKAIIHFGEKFNYFDSVSIWWRRQNTFATLASPPSACATSPGRKKSSHYCL